MYLSRKSPLFKNKTPCHVDVASERISYALLTYVFNGKKENKKYKIDMFTSWRV